MEYAPSISRHAKACAEAMSVRLTWHALISDLYLSVMRNRMVADSGGTTWWLPFLIKL
jgi:hypothetical protein